MKEQITFRHRLAMLMGSRSLEVYIKSLRPFEILVRIGEDAVKWRPWKVGLQCESRQPDHIPTKAVMLHISRKSAGTTY